MFTSSKEDLYLFLQITTFKKRLLWFDEKYQMIWPIIVHILVTNKFIFFFNSFGTARWNLSCFCPLSSYCTCIWYTTKEWQRVTIVIWALQHVSNIETPISLLRDISLAHLFSLYLKVSSLYRKKKIVFMDSTYIWSEKIILLSQRFCTCIM